MAVIDFKISIKKDMCHLLLTENIRNNEVTKEEIINDLKQSGIVAGIKEDVIDEILAGKHKTVDKIVIAENIPPLKGKKGDVKYLIVEKIEIKRDEKGNADFYEAGLIKNVNEGEKLIEIIPPQEGKPGKTILGEEIKGLLGEAAFVKKYTGLNTIITPDNKYVIAKKAGVYKRNLLGVVAIVDELDIKTDVNFSVGNIETSSAVTIKGDIKSGFKCVSKSSISVSGVIEDAYVEAGDNLICKLGILQGEEPIKAKNEIRTKYIRSRKIVEAKDLIVEEMISNSNIKCIGSVNVRKLTGGTCFVLNSLTANEIGNEQYVDTVIEMGVNYKILDRIRNSRVEISICQKDIVEKEEIIDKSKLDLKKVQRRLTAFLSGNSANKQIAEKMQEETKEYTKQINILNAEINQNNMRMNSLKKGIEKLTEKTGQINPQVLVKEVIYPNVTIRLSEDVKYTVDKIMKRVKFFVDAAGALKIVNI